MYFISRMQVQLRDIQIYFLSYRIVMVKRREIVQWIECILQVELWKPCCHATIGHMYREIADYWYNKTTDGLPGNMACADFGMRGMSCMDEATRCSASWLLSFNKTSTIPAINYIDRYYNADCKNNGIGSLIKVIMHFIINKFQQSLI